MTTLYNHIPSLERRWLYLLAGVVWSAVGVMLCTRAGHWLLPEPASRALPLALAGLASGMLINHFKFSKLAHKNIKRIEELPTPSNLLQFQSGKTYLLIVIMMGLGAVLRRSSIPKPTLAVLYTGIGIGMLLSSLDYYRHVA